MSGGLSGAALALASLAVLSFGCGEGDPAGSSASAGSSGGAGGSASGSSGPSAGGGGPSGPGSTAAGSGGAGGSAGSGSALAWESVETVASDDAILVQKVSYRSGGLKIHGRLCRPIGPGPYPLHVINHGGWFGLGGNWGLEGGCADPARGGYVVIESSYRGEDGSDGEVELCLGEVDDVLAMIEVARAEDYVDPSRVTMMGGSHGGCITLRAIERGVPVGLAIAIAPPTDWAKLHPFWKAQRDKTTGDARAFYELLLGQIEVSAGGTPAERPEAYAARSPLAFVDDLEGFSGALLVAHGDADAIVPPDEACAFAVAAGGFEAFHVDAAGKEQTSPPSGCAGSGVAWKPGPRPTSTWPADRYLTVYDGFGHSGLEVPEAKWVLGDVVGFFFARAP